MVDMHIHSIYSDGDKTISEILKMCEEKNLEYISITDHNTCEQYNDKVLVNNKIFTGKIIQGTELYAVFKNRSFEILGYNVNSDIINKWSKNYYSEDKLKHEQITCATRLLEACDKLGIIYDKDKIEKPKKVTEYMEISIYNELISHKENIKVLGELSNSFNLFFRKGLANPQSPYFTNRMEFRPKYEEVIDIIHKANGMAFLAHPFEYKFNDTISFINDLRKTSELDGIECFHPSSSDNNKSDILVEYARKNNLYISGGSDYHGNTKPNIEIGTGSGNLNIKKEIIKEWL